MLSGRLIRVIENHEEEITNTVVAAIRRHPELTHLRNLRDLELRERCREILKNLGHWLLRGNEEELDGKYEAIGKLRFEESIPLDECVLGLCILKYKMIAFLDDQGIEPDTLALYARGELLRRIGPFFDLLVVHLVRGYEDAERISARVA